MAGLAAKSDRENKLHECREALLAALEAAGEAVHGRNRLARQQFGAARIQNPRSDEVDPRSHAERAAADPRIWYLLGLVLCDLGAYSDARIIYRQVLSRLPMASFAHVVHFNRACIHAVLPGEKSRTS